MWIADVSVKRPVFATVLALLLVAFGLLSYSSLPVREYPDVSSPVVSIRTSYPGASASVMEARVTQVLEDAVSGVEGIHEIRSSSSDGNSSITIEFDLGRNIDEAANDIRDRVARTQRRLPQDVDPPTVSKQDADANPVVYLMLTSDQMQPLELRDFVERNVVEQFSILPGVSEVNVGGPGRPAMRIWLDRLQMAARNLTVSDIEAALRRENLELPAGRIDSIDREFPIRLNRQYQSAEEFSRLVIRQAEDGHLIRLGEIARVEEGADNVRQMALTNGETIVSIGIVKQSTANTVEVLEAVNAAVDSLNASLPDHLTLTKNQDASVFIKAAINAVYSTIFMTTLLVGLVIWIFLGQLKTTLIPMVTVPVCLIASFIALNSFGYSINLITLLAMVLSIGLVVDDSIVVLENVHRRIEAGEPPLLAAIAGTKQVGFAVIATTAVLVAVFAPILFLKDNMGVVFVELAVTVSSAVIFSSVLALSLAPMLCSKLLVAEQGNQRPRFFDIAFNWLRDRYRPALAFALNHAWLSLVAVLVMGGGAFLLAGHLPQEYAPTEDQRSFVVRISVPEGTSFAKLRGTGLEMLEAFDSWVEEGVMENYSIRVPGFGSNNSGGVIFASLYPEDQTASEATTQEVIDDLQAQWARIPDVRAFAFQRQGLSRGGGGSPIQIALLGPNYDVLADWRDIILDAARDYPGIQRMDSDLRETQSQVHVNVDPNRAAALGVSMQTVGSTLQTMMSERQVTTYEVDGEEYQVLLQAEDSQRRSPQDLSNIFVRSNTGELVPLANLISIENEAGIATLNRFNRARSVTLNGNLAPGYSLGEVLGYLEQVIDEQLPETAAFAYRGQSKEYFESAGGIYFTFGVALFVVFLVMAAQFESFLHPLLIMFTVPMAVFGALVGLLLTGNSFNIYSQIGIVMLIGISTKNGILIVEFINQLRDEGLEFQQAIMDAALIRFRPVLMTTFSTLIGALPLMFLTGPGSVSRQVLGAVIFFGVVFSAFLTLFVIPGVYKLLARGTQSPQTIAKEVDRLQAAHANGLALDP